MKRRLTKTLLYRLSTVLIQQTLTWAVFRRLDFNLLVGIGEFVRCSYYYGYDWLWERKTICPKCKGKGYYYEGDVDIIDVDSDSLFAGLVVCECRKKEVENAKA